MKRFRKLLSMLAAFLALSAPATARGLDVGERAPAFTAESTRGRISLADFAGRRHVVLALYFAVFTPVWTEELIAFQRDLEEFQRLDAQVIGVSTDRMEDQRKFARENGIAFPLVSDDRRAVKKAYGWGRVTYLIDKDGVVRFVQKGVPDNRAFLDRLAALQ